MLHHLAGGVIGHGETDIVGFTRKGLSNLGRDGDVDPEADDVVSLRVYVTVPAQVAQSLTRESYDIRFTMTDDTSGEVVEHDAVFRAPGG